MASGKRSHEAATGSDAACTCLRLAAVADGVAIFFDVADDEGGKQSMVSSGHKLGEFLLHIAELRARGAFIHEFRLTAASVSAALAGGTSAETILQQLQRYHAGPLPSGAQQLVNGTASTAIKLVECLHEGNQWLEGDGLEHVLAECAGIAACCDDGAKLVPGSVLQLIGAARQHNIMLARELKYFDPVADRDVLVVPWKLLPTAVHHPHQIAALRAIFGMSAGRARSGVIVLPCGAGKTLTGISAAATLGGATIVMCPHVAAVEQWRAQLLKWTDIGEKRVARLSSAHKERLPSAGGVLITTFAMMARGDREAMLPVCSFNWRLCILDEVHAVPAREFATAVRRLNAGCTIGLTATLLREDNLIHTLDELVGPRLYEATWKDLESAGYIAPVACFHVQCPMTALFMEAYLKTVESGPLLWGVEAEPEGSFDAVELCILNPTKVRCAERIVKAHLAHHDKVLLFCDRRKALHWVAERLGAPAIDSDTSEGTRQELFDAFRLAHDAPGSQMLLCLTSVGDVAIDLPDAAVVVQLSCVDGSRRQESQRLGRITRPKKPRAKPAVAALDDVAQDDVVEPKAFFYSLASADTAENKFAERRRAWLIDQGYTYKVIASTDIQMQLEAIGARALAPVSASGIPSACATEEDERALLQSLTTTQHQTRDTEHKERAGLARQLSDH
jgi:DNA repair helicase Rad25